MMGHVDVKKVTVVVTCALHIEPVLSATEELQLSTLGFFGIQQDGACAAKSTAHLCF